MECKRIKYR